ncbi:thioesterase II family protein, partial [Mycolicibacter algericus]
MTDRTPKLYIFPHAGGSPQYYLPFSKAFTADVKRIGVQYPGKGGNHDLGAFTSIEDLADRVCEKLAPPADECAAFFGPGGHLVGGRDVVFVAVESDDGARH